MTVSLSAAIKCAVLDHALIAGLADRGDDRRYVGDPEKITSARFVARLTAAEATPGVARIAFSTRSTQDEQAMPSTRRLKVAAFFGSREKDIDAFLYLKKEPVRGFVLSVLSNLTFWDRPRQFDHLAAA